MKQEDNRYLVAIFNTEGVESETGSFCLIGNKDTAIEYALEKTSGKVKLKAANFTLIEWSEKAKIPRRALVSPLIAESIS
ncbi:MULTISPECIES: hypothetical protein [Vibrio]|uniref:Uncharacterized protein n=1 Tax=Vibrio tasmaniensis TaxID=212663 RepID=A0A2N7NNG8_9VIBR|nr:hypothetical protein [Vibrio tasmaniensis]PMO80328.1 hypothetical protein BCT01_08535 [Vibrio tasmaniensis]PMP17804.1 hypothetical protein BCS92_05195 [Vibrio tasmaniensis]TKG29009.1 hypothetical protein FC057_20195 [Vibrio tasmaniensis]TKG41592.1 hypothetical protein FC063_06955 [Vibrio tasmaniensis]TKG46241.1 hypothetical protein FC070_22420 [Vibrio tasmaniensis]